jgi:hypothetical protein
MRGGHLAIRAWNKAIAKITAPGKRRLVVEASKCVAGGIRSDGLKGRLEIYFGVEAREKRG